MTNLETKIKEWLEDEIQSSREVIAEYTDNHRPKCDDGSDDFIEGINFRCLNAEGIWHTEGRSYDALEVDLWNKVEAYIGMPLARLEYCKNQPHKLTSFK